MRSLKLTLAYDGTHFAGWQVQLNARTVQQVLEKAWNEITGESTRLIASGRTDSGVHALAQVVSLATESRLNAAVLQKALNARLPNAVVVLSVEEAPDDFHAIRDAVRKRYRYVMHDGPVADPFRRHFCWNLWQRLDAAAMHRAAQPLIGEHEFTSFQSSGSGKKTTVRTVSDLFVRREEGGQSDLILLEIEASGFLYNMVRAIVGVLVEVGRGARDEAWPEQVLKAADRRAAAMTAPPQGLFLVKVEYE